jgi:Zn-dependent metalloprotease
MCVPTPHHVCFIVPPHILEHVVRSTRDMRMRERALQNLQLQARLRGMREGLSQYSFAGLGTGTRRRTIYDAQHTVQLPGALVRSEGRHATADVAVTEAYDYSGATYDFYAARFGRTSVDDNGMRLDSTVHYSREFDNAFWNGQQMVYGDGDGRLFERFTKCIDVVGHELTHGVTQFTAGLAYQGQAGALNESMSDVFGVMLKQSVQKQKVSDSNWLIGEGLFILKRGSNRKALRSLKAPGTAYDDPLLGKDPQPAHMDDYDGSAGDHGGVHVNSGIPNHAFYLAATRIGGYAWQTAGRIWYEVLTTRLQANSGFIDAASATRDVAQKYGTKVFGAVDKAWTAVGL